MKKSILSLVFISLFGLMSYAQGNLQFNQIKVVTDEETVPTGKVWKVVSAMSASAGTKGEAFTMLVNGQPVYLSYYNSGDRYWDNIMSIQFETRKNGGAACSNSDLVSMAFEYDGYEKDFPFQNRRSAWAYRPNLYPTTWTTMFTVTPQDVSMPMSITAMRLGGATSVRIPDQVEFRLTVTYNDNSTQSIMYGPYAFSCCGCSGGSTHYFIGSTTALFQMPSTSKDFFYLPTSLPLWLPSGFSLGKGNKISGLSVIEFNIIP